MTDTTTSDVTLIEDMEADAKAAEDRAADRLDNFNLPQIGSELYDLHRQVKEAEERIKELKRQIETIEVKVIPDRLAALGITYFGFTTPDGDEKKISVGVEVQGSLSRAPDIEAAIKLLEEGGLSGGVKTILSIDFTEDQRSEAEEWADRLRSDTHDVHVERKLNAGTLKAFGRRMAEKNDGFDLEAVGLSSWRRAKIS